MKGESRELVTMNYLVPTIAATSEFLALERPGLGRVIQMLKSCSFVCHKLQEICVQ